MKTQIKALAIATSLLFSASVLAEIAIIVHPSNGDTITQDDISKLFLGKDKSFPGGAPAVPINQGGAIGDEFNEKALNKSSTQMKAYWSKLVFTGKGTPPKDAASDEEAKALVAGNPNLIGYIDASKVDGSVKVVLKL
ncbi:phosphate ABC transporter substrate-binding protein [Bowmanella sp. JS7-9]|uniref:Phosphate ABC transporter substrate-binding protein n=1 Tax=Pseudobowmanella zhangzhouensis TaxID=1537679 RepID=A0ABW1XLH8_9ALTE|nr:phosphate ABC transporter substrate-binding protein [Bowmanella sp. JS7-9]